MNVVIQTAKHRRWDGGKNNDPVVCVICAQSGANTSQSLRHVGEDDLPVCVCSHMLEAHTDNGCMDCGCDREWGEEAL